MKLAKYTILLILNYTGFVMGMELPSTKQNKALSVGAPKKSKANPQGLLPCVVSGCWDRFDKILDYENHLISHAKTKPYACENCDHKCASKHNIIIHTLRYHDKHIPNIPLAIYEYPLPSEAVKKYFPYSCNLCNQSFETHFGLRNHASAKAKQPNHTKAKLIALNLAAITMPTSINFTLAPAVSEITIPLFAASQAAAPKFSLVPPPSSKTLSRCAFCGQQFSKLKLTAHVNQEHKTATPVFIATSEELAMAVLTGLSSIQVHAGIKRKMEAPQ